MLQAFGQLEDLGEVAAISAVIDSAPLGPSSRLYANAAVILTSDHDPEAFFDRLQAIERGFGTRRGGRWRARVLDLDIVLWDGGIWASQGLAIPHPAFRERDFVLGPAREIAPDWRDPVTGLSLCQLFARLTKPRAAPS